MSYVYTKQAASRQADSTRSNRQMEAQLGMLREASKRYINSKHNSNNIDNIGNISNISIIKSNSSRTSNNTLHVFFLRW